MPAQEIEQRREHPELVLRQLPRTVTLDHIECRTASDGGLTFEGHAAVFDSKSEVLYDMWGPFREIVKPAAFAEVIEANADGREDTKFLGLNHDRNRPLARCGNDTLKLEEDDTGLFVRADLAPTATAQELGVLLTRRDVHQMSFTFTLAKDGETWSWDEEGDIREVLNVKRLYDVSPVVYPAYTETDAGLRALAELRALAVEIDAGRRSADPAHLTALGQMLAMADELPPAVVERARQIGRRDTAPPRDEIAAAARARKLRLRELALQPDFLRPHRGGQHHQQRTPTRKGGPRMSDVLTKLREAREERASVFETMKSIQDKADSEGRDLTPEEHQEWDRADSRFVELGGDDGTGGEIGRLERHAQRLRGEDDASRREQRPEKRKMLPDGVTDDDGGTPTMFRSYAEFIEAEGRNRPNAVPEYAGAFYRHLRGGLTEARFARLPAEDQRLLDAAREDPGEGEARALSHVTGAEGGYAVPVTTESRIIERADKVSPLRRLCQVITTTSGEKINIPLEAGIGAADWVAENTEYTEADVVMGTAPLNAYKVVTVSWVPRELLTDATFDIEAYLIRVLGRRIGAAESAAFATGAPADPMNPGKPTGIYGKFSVGQTIDGTFAAGTLFGTLKGDALIEMQESVDDPYRSNAVWSLSKSAVKFARKLKDSNGQYLLVPGLREGESDLLLGDPINREPYLPTAAAGTVLAAYGDFEEAAIIRDVAGVYIQRLNEVRATKGQVGFLADHRTDINVVNADAVKTLKAAPAS